MPTTAKIVALCFCLEACALVAVGQQQPALPPTIAAPTDDFTKPPPVPQRLPRVEYTAERLQVLADNSSMAQILNEVSTRLGMKISGSIPEERVFGSYGPGEPATVLAHLLAGYGNNFLMREDARRIPRELILTRRTGGPTPPSPHKDSVGPAADQVESEELPPRLIPRNDRPQQQPFPAPVNTNQPSLPASAPTGHGAFPPVSTPPQSPNGAKTPQEIYDQLVQMQQKNAPAAPQ